MNASPPNSPVLIYDGRCGLCHRAVRHILKYDRTGKFRFAANTTPTGLSLLAEAGFESGKPPETMVLLADDRVFTHSAAAFEIARQLGGIHALAAPGRLVPRVLRDRLYSLVARLRYRIFGKYDACRLPSPAERARFLDAGELAAEPGHEPEVAESTA
jgi:predicted DCC family thiol-disulfide oxidoreductase YuxK